MEHSDDSHHSDWILLALLAAADQGLTAVKLQKTLFLLGERGKNLGTTYYTFHPYHYGPFDADVYRDADHLQRSGLIEVDMSQGRSLRKYVLTAKGREVAHKISSKRPDKTKAYLDRVVRWIQPLPFNVLVRAIYDEFPSMRANSIFEEH